MIIGGLGVFTLILIGVAVFYGTKLTLLGLVLVTGIYGLARWRVGYPCWDNPEGPIKSALATALLVCIVYIWGSTIYHNQDTVKPIVDIVDNIIKVFAK